MKSHLDILISVASSVLLLCCAATGGGNAQLPDCGLSNKGSPRIVGGADAEIDSYPWQVALERCDLYTGECALHCGGSLISPSWVLTAAHCASYVSAGSLQVVVGSSEYNQEVSESAVKYQVKDILDHPAYCSDSDEFYDISLLQLTEAVDLKETGARTICLPDAGQDFTGEECVITGWGDTDYSGELSEVLQSAKVTLGDWDNCRSIPELGERLERKLHICAGNLTDGGVDTCQGDSGGPLACQRKDGRWVLAGLTSYGIGCGWPGYYGIYARVSSFLDWIDDVMSTEHNLVQVSETEPLPPVDQYQLVEFTCRPRSFTSTENTTIAENFTNDLENTTDAENVTGAVNVTISNVVKWYIQEENDNSYLGLCDDSLGGCHLFTGAVTPLWTIKLRLRKEWRSIYCADDEGNILALWDFTIVVPPDNFVCIRHLDHTTGQLRMECSAQDVYPSDRKCLLDIYDYNSGIYTTESSSLLTVTSWSTPCRDYSYCHFELSAAQLGTGRHGFNVTLYPTSSDVSTAPSGYNITRLLPDVVVGLSAPSLSHCPVGPSVNGSYVLSGSRAGCACFEESPGFPQALLGMTVQAGGNTRNTSNEELIDTASFETQTFECYSWSPLLPGRSPSVYQTVYIASGPYPSMITLNRTDVTSSPSQYRKCSGLPIQMTCHVTGVVPEAEVLISMQPYGKVIDVKCSDSGLCTYSFIPRLTGRHEFSCQAWNALFPVSGPRVQSPTFTVQVSDTTETPPLLTVAGRNYTGNGGQMEDALTAGRTYHVRCSIEGASPGDVIVSCADVTVTAGTFTPTIRHHGLSCQCQLDVNNCDKVTTKVTLRVKEESTGPSDDNDDNDDSDDSDDSNGSDNLIIGLSVGGSLAVLLIFFAVFRYWWR